MNVKHCGIILPVLLVLVLKLSNNEGLMGNWKNKRFQNVLAGSLTGFISLVTLALLVTSILGWTPWGILPVLSGYFSFWVGSGF